MDEIYTLDIILYLKSILLSIYVDVKLLTYWMHFDEM